MPCLRSHLASCALFLSGALSGVVLLRLLAEPPPAPGLRASPSPAAAAAPLLAASAAAAAPPPAAALAPPAYSCSAAEAAAQVEGLNPSDSSCPSDVYGALHAPLACAESLTLVDVGANKGLVLASWIALFNPGAGVDAAAASARFVAAFPAMEGGDVACGACGDCSKPPPKRRVGEGPCVGGSGAAGPRLSLHALEPAPANAALIDAGVGALAAAAGVQFSLHRVAAVGDASLTSVRFGDCPPGREVCGVHTPEAGAGGPGVYDPPIVDVPAVTLDAWVATARLEALDILAIDTEGLDALVLQGARGVLNGSALPRRVKIVQFEYHSFRAWQYNSLEDVVNTLDSSGYDCYLLMQRKVLRLTRCWHPALEFHYWSNVMCALRAEVALNAALTALAPLW